MTGIERINKLHGEEPSHVSTKGGAYNMLPIHYALMNNAPLVVIQRIYNLHQDGIKASHDDGWMPLHFACYYNRHEAIQWLRKTYGEAASKRDKHGRTPLDIATHYKHTECIEEFAVARVSSIPKQEESSPQEAPSSPGNPSSSSGKKCDVEEMKEEPNSPQNVENLD